MPKTICLLVLLAAAATVAAQTYKWKDASGATQYSDTPPPSNARDVQQLRKAGTPVPSAPSAGTAPQSKSTADAEAEFRKRMAAREEAEAKQAKAQEDEQTRVRHCDQSKAQLSALESGNRVARYLPSGERVALDDSEREQAKAEAQKAVQTWCK